MHATRDELPILFGADPAVIRGADWEGLRSMIISLPAGTDLAPPLKGLPNDLCPCPHWGYILKGRIRVTYADSVEILQAGDLYTCRRGTRRWWRRTSSSSSSAGRAEIQPVLGHVARVAAGAA